MVPSKPYIQDETCIQTQSVVSVRADAGVSDKDYMAYLRRFHVKYHERIISEDLPSVFVSGERCTIIRMQFTENITLEDTTVC